MAGRCLRIDAAAPRRVESASQEDRADLAEGRALVAPPSAKNAAVVPGRRTDAYWAKTRYAMDFARDRLANGRRFKSLRNTDPCSKEVPVIEVHVSVGGARVRRISESAVCDTALPKTVILDNESQILRVGLGYVGRLARRENLHFLQPRKPVQDAFIESFKGKFRDECLNKHWFLTVREAQVAIKAWRQEYNDDRTHGTIGDVTPM